MVTKAKEPPEVETPEPEPKVEKSELVDAVKEVLEELGIKKGEPEVEEPEAKPEKRPTARDEEATMNERVRSAVKEFLASDEAKPKEDPKKEPEVVPGSPTVRKIEKLLWGKE